MKKRIFLLMLVVLMICMLSACGCKHTWEEATCFAPKTCSKCGETEGQAEAHVWTDATCLAPKTCSKCGNTMGEANAHNWVEATCLDPMTCADCGTTEGEAIGHTWADATCLNPMTCTVCAATEGEANPHDVAFADLNENVLTVTCKVCGETVTETLEDPAAYALELLAGQWTAVSIITYEDDTMKESDLRDDEMNVAITKNGTASMLPDNTDLGTYTYQGADEETLDFELDVESESTYLMLSKENIDVLYVLDEASGYAIMCERQ